MIPPGFKDHDPEAWRASKRESPERSAEEPPSKTAKAPAVVDEPAADDETVAEAMQLEEYLKGVAPAVGLTGQSFYP